MERMDDTLFWVLVVVGILAVPSLIGLLVYLRRRKSSKPDTKRSSTEESVNQVLRGIRSNGDQLEVVHRRDGSETTADETEIAAGAAKAMSQMKNGHPPKQL